MTREDLIKRLENEACYEAIYNDSEGRQIVVIRGLELYGFINTLLKEQREECAKRAEVYAYMSENFNALAEELREIK